MKNNVNRVKKSPRFTVLDALIILLVIVVVVGIYFRHNIIEFVTNSRDLGDYTVSYTIENVRYTTPDFINIGDEVYFDDGEYFGTFTTVSENKSALNIVPATEYFKHTTDEGTVEYVERSYPEDTRVRASGRLECVGRYSDDGGFLVDGSRFIAAGQKINVKTESVTVTIRIDEISVSESE